MDKIIYIALVDDHGMFRQGLAQLINLFPGYKVLFDVGNGKELMRKLRPNALPDIVLLDINMPEMDGFETAAWLTTSYPQIKVLALSMLNNEAATIKMIRSGACGYIFKNADTAELKAAFKEVLENGFYFNTLVSAKLLRSINTLVSDRPTNPALANLTEREQTFLKKACSEKSYKQIAAEMFVSERTVDGYRDALFKKLNVSTRVGLVLWAIKSGIMPI